MTTQNQTKKLKEALALELFELGVILFGDFQLKSGIKSPFYLDLRQIIAKPQVILSIADLMLQDCSKKMQLVCGVPYTALPIATAISLKASIPMVMRRKEKKDYGTKKMIEGKFTQGEDCWVIEDLITTGSSVLETKQVLEDVGLKVSHTSVLIDREQGGLNKLESEGIKVSSIFTLTELLKMLQGKGKISKQQVKTVEQFIGNFGKQ